MTDSYSAGFPHSEISGSMRMCRSPELIAACHVLLRLLMPRHSPCAFFRLIYWFSRIMQASFRFRLSKLLPNFLQNFAFCCLACPFALCSVFNVQMVGQSGLEPPTSRLSVVCSSQLSYWPLPPERTAGGSLPLDRFPLVSRGFGPLGPSFSI